MNPDYAELSDKIDIIIDYLDEKEQKK